VYLYPSYRAIQTALVLAHMSSKRLLQKVVASIYVPAFTMFDSIYSLAWSYHRSSEDGVAPELALHGVLSFFDILSLAKGCQYAIALEMWLI
jgi:hypothetical protein